MSTTHDCPMFNTERAQKIETTLERMDERLKFWIGNGQPGIVQRMKEQQDAHHEMLLALRRVPELIEKLEEQRDLCRLDCDSKINLIRKVADDPPRLHALSEKVESHDEYIAGQQTLERRSNRLWDRAQKWLGPILAASVAGLLGYLLKGR